MEKLRLTAPSMAYAKQLAAYRKEFLQSGEQLSGGGGLEDFEEMAQWLAWVEKLSNRETCPAGYVPASQFLCVRTEDDRLVGMINVRWELNEYLSKYGGHIGYSVRPSERKKGNAKEQLRLALMECRKLRLVKVLITCDRTNEASRKTILSAGGVYDGEELDPRDGEMTQRYWVTIPPAKQPE